MACALIHYPACDLERINQLRRKYDPQFNLLAPHITIVFPVPDSLGEQRLLYHTNRILNGRKPFPFRLKGLQKSADDYLFLTVAEGAAALVRLHEEMYTGPLAAHRRADLPFIPHITLGRFTEESSRFEQALKEAEQLNLDFACTLDRLHLIRVNDDRSCIVWTHEFSL